MHHSISQLTQNSILHSSLWERGNTVNGYNGMHSWHGMLLETSHCCLTLNAKTSCLILSWNSYKECTFFMHTSSFRVPHKHIGWLWRPQSSTYNSFTKDFSLNATTELFTVCAVVLSCIICVYKFLSCQLIEEWWQNQSHVTFGTECFVKKTQS